MSLTSTFRSTGISVSLLLVPWIVAGAQSASSISQLASRPSDTVRTVVKSDTDRTVVKGDTVKTEVRVETVKVVNGAANNPWIAGAQLGYKFAGSGDFADNLLVAGTVVHHIKLDTKKSHDWHLPVISNIASLAAEAAGAKSSQDSVKAAANALLSSAQGISVRLAPYRVFRNATNTQVTGFASVGAKVNSLAAKDTALGDQELLQGQLGLGVDLALGESRDEAEHRPLTITIAWLASYFSEASYEKIFGERKSELKSLAVTAMLPIQPGTGVLAEAVMSKGLSPAIRLGLLVAKK